MVHRMACSPWIRVGIIARCSKRPINTVVATVHVVDRVVLRYKAKVEHN